MINFHYSFWNTWNTQANSLGEAIASLYNRQAGINQLCYDAGSDYVKDISPSYKTEYRNIYTRAGHSPFAFGSRLALAGNWNEAAYILEFIFAIWAKPKKGW